MVDQQREPAELVYILGGQLAIRQVRSDINSGVVGLTVFQGARAHWSSENTAMHAVRSNDGRILIDEIDLVRLSVQRTLTH